MSAPLWTYQDPAEIKARLTVLYDKRFRIKLYNKTLDAQTLDGKQRGIMADHGCKLGRDRMPKSVSATLNRTIAILEERLADKQAERIAA